MAMPDGRSVVLIGSACCDIRATIGGCFAPGATTPGRVRLSLGGTARNIAENLARLDVPTRLLTAVGDDETGRQIVRYTRAAGVLIADDDLLVAAGQPSGAFLTVLQDGKEFVVA